MKVFYTSNIGRKKSNNEDSLLIDRKIISESNFDFVLEEEIESKEFYLAIADGMGGYDFGEVASKSILEFLLKYDMTDVEVASNILKNIQKDLYKLSFYHKKYSGMGSVLSGIKVLEKSIELDYKIDQKFPNYKDNIKDKYHDLKEKAVSTYLNMTEDICTNNESLCTTAKENFNTMKNSFAITYDYIKEKAKSGSEKLKEWLKNR